MLIIKKFNANVETLYQINRLIVITYTSESQTYS
jgi:hypothetical protein